MSIHILRRCFVSRDPRPIHSTPPLPPRRDREERRPRDSRASPFAIPPFLVLRPSFLRRAHRRLRRLFRRAQHVRSGYRVRFLSLLTFPVPVPVPVPVRVPGDARGSGPRRFTATASSRRSAHRLSESSPSAEHRALALAFAFAAGFLCLFRLAAVLSAAVSTSAAARSTTASSLSACASRSILRTRSRSLSSRASALSSVCTRLAWRATSAADLNGAWSTHSGRSHLKRRSTVWVRSCWRRCSRVLKDLPHPSCAHAKGLSVRWVRRCFSRRARPCSVTNEHPGWGHARGGGFAGRPELGEGSGAPSCA